MNDRFIIEDKLVKHDLSADEINAYLDYQRVVRLKNDTTYLAKNNNFILRYESVRSQNEAFLIIILYRHPLYHAASLLEKHLQYSEMQKDDPFVLEYMDWLGHHEFGLNQKPFEFENNHLVTGDKSTLDYWLRIWINYYRYARGLKHEKTVFISYEAYCSDPNKATSTIFNLLGLSESKKDMKGFNNTREVDYIYDATLLEDAMEIYRSFSR